MYGLYAEETRVIYRTEMDRNLLVDQPSKLYLSLSGYHRVDQNSRRDAYRAGLQYRGAVALYSRIRTTRKFLNPVNIEFV